MPFIAALCAVLNAMLPRRSNSAPRGTLNGQQRLSLLPIIFNQSETCHRPTGCWCYRCAARRDDSLPEDTALNDPNGALPFGKDRRRPDPFHGSEALPVSYPLAQLAMKVSASAPSGSSLK